MSKPLDAIAARIEAATGRPWRADKRGYGVGVSYEDKWDEEMQLFVETNGLTYTPNPADAEFIAQARTDLPRLLAAVRAAEAVQGAEPTNDQWNMGYNDALEDVHRALTEALEGER